MYRNEARLEAISRGAVVSRYMLVAKPKYSCSLGHYTAKEPFEQESI